MFRSLPDGLLASATVDKLENSLNALRSLKLDATDKGEAGDATPLRTPLLRLFCRTGTPGGSNALGFENVSPHIATSMPSSFCEGGTGR